MEWVLLLLVGLAFFANLEILRLLRQSHVRRQLSGIKDLLLFITVTEIIFCLASLIEGFLTVTEAIPQGYTMRLVIVSAVSTSLAARNWAMGSAAVARWIRESKLCSSCRMVIIIAIVACVILCLSIINFIVSGDTFKFVHFFIQIVIQKCFPLLCDVTALIGLSVKLCRYVPPEDEEPKRADSKLILILATLFAAFEGASVLINFFSLRASQDLTGRTMLRLYFSDKCLLYVNSLSNFFALFFCNKTFRQHFILFKLCLICRKKSASTERARREEEEEAETEANVDA